MSSILVVSEIQGAIEEDGPRLPEILALSPVTKKIYREENVLVCVIQKGALTYPLYTYKAKQKFNIVMYLHWPKKDYMHCICKVWSCGVPQSVIR